MKRILLSLSILLISGISAVSSQSLFDSPEFKAFEEAFFGDSSQEKKPFDDGKKFKEGKDFFDRATALFSQKKYAETIPLYTSAAKAWEECLNIEGYNYTGTKKNIAIAYSNVGTSYRLQEKYGEALPFLTKSIGYDPENSFTYQQLGFVYEGLKQYDKAEEDYKQMIRINPDNGVAYAAVGNIYYFNKEKNVANKNTALYFYEKALARVSSFSESVYDRVTLSGAEMNAKELKEEGYSSSRANPAAIAIPTSAGTSGTAQSTTTTSGSSTATTSGSSTATSADYVRTRIGQLLKQCGATADGDWAFNGSLETNSQKALGIYQWADGTTYMGEYINGNFNGSCIIIPAKGEYYDDIPGWSFFQGVYENGKPKFGSGYDKNGNYIDTGIYINGKLQERYVNEDSKKGVIKLEVIVYDKDDSKNRDFYIGLTRYGKRHARGLLVWKNAGWYYGNWNVDKQQGLGMQVYSDGKYTTGKWSNGEFVQEL